MKTKNKLSLFLALTMLLSMTASVSLADEYAFFHASVSGILDNGRGQITSQEVARVEVIDDYLAIDLPVGWEKADTGDPDIATYRCTQDGTNAEMLIGFDFEEETPYEYLRTECDNISSVSCKVKKSSFEWEGYEVPGHGILVLHRGVNGKNYLIGLSYDGETPAAQSGTTRSFYTITRSLRLADQTTLSLRKLLNPQPAEEPQPAQPLQFADPAFENMLCDALLLPEGTPITAEMTELITSLYFSSGQLNLYGYYAMEYREDCAPLSLTDLKHFPSLTTLYVCDMELLNTEVLGECPGLTDVSFIGCSLSSCDLVAPCTNLVSLSLARNDIASLEPIRGLTKLKELNLHCTAVEDLSPLCGMKELQELRLSQTRVASLEPLSQCTALEGLYASEISGSILSLKPLGGLEHLNHLDLSKTSVCDQEFILRVSNIKLGSW